jgi:restriction system protein
MTIGAYPIAAAPIGAISGEASLTLTDAVLNATLRVSSLILPAGKTHEGTLVASTSKVWGDIVRFVGDDWSRVIEIPSEIWEEIVAGAFHKAGFEDVILTPRSGDHGRDVIASTRGVGCIKIIDSVKAYAPGSTIPYDDVRALLGVMSGEQNASKGIITTTADFPPNIESDPFIKPFLPTRLELMNGKSLQEWLKKLNATS